jgi:5'(3')-deoxyribonucleotidase
MLKASDFRIFIDLDGVIADWVGKAVKSFGLNIKNKVVHDILNTDVRGIEQFIDTEFMWQVINDGGTEWWEDIKPFPWAKYLYDQACGLGQVCFLTQPSPHGSSSSGKAHWIQRHFNGTKNYLLGAPKEFCAGPYSYLIDDTPKKIARFDQAGGHGVLFPNSFAIAHGKHGEEHLLQSPLCGRSVVDSVISHIAQHQTSLASLPS